MLVHGPALTLFPCSQPAGTFNPETGQASIVACIACGEGTASPVVGANSSATCKPCAKGTYNAMAQQAICASCQPGTYQNEMGSTECKLCEPGSYCPRGTSAPLPCRECATLKLTPDHERLLSPSLVPPHPPNAAQLVVRTTETLGRPAALIA